MKITAHVWVSQEFWQENPQFMISSSDFSDMGYELVSSHEVEFDAPENFSKEQFQLRKLAKEKEAAIDAFHKKIAQIEDQIKKYQCLEMS